MKSDYNLHLFYLLIFLFSVHFSAKCQTNYHQVNLFWDIESADCSSNNSEVCFTAYINSPDQDIELDRITIKLVYDQALYSNAIISTLSANYVASEISENAATVSSGIAAFDFGGAPIFYEGVLSNVGIKSNLISAPQAFFKICLDAQPGILTPGNEEFLTLLWDQISNDLNATSFDAASQGIEVSIGGPNDEADETVYHYGWDYGLGNGIFGGPDLSQSYISPCQLDFCLLDSDFGITYRFLKNLYFSTFGLGWTNSDNWLDDNCLPCDWYGITCNTLNQVETIDLSGNNLIGQLPSSILLPNAEVLDFRDNQLKGLIPIFPIASTAIRLDSNFFEGPIPEHLGNLPNLDVLTAESNLLSSCYPATLFNLCDISELSFLGNALLPNFGNIDPFCNNLDGACSIVFDDCDGTLALITESPISNGILRMKEYIVASGKVQSPNLFVSFEAGDFIGLLPGFEVQVPAMFEAIIDDCNN